uniref:Ras guanine nucleotide exchange factor glfB-like C-terminal domain-containing protein n=1 Tax=Entamoeba invadens TaxID=33085 RepID=S0B163_ENTIV|nr:hypothetical protein [Entamoeba invadens]
MSAFIISFAVFAVIAVVAVVLFVTRVRTNTTVPLSKLEYIPETITLEGMTKDVKESYRKPVANTSVYIDLPRLAPKVLIFAKSQLVVSGAKVAEDHPDYRCEEAIKGVLVGLSNALSENKLSENLLSTFDAHFPYIKNGKKCDAAMFNKTYLEDNFKEGDLVLCVLKTITQCMFASAVQYYVPLRIKSPYRDVTNGWVVEIRIDEDNIIVKHIKSEESLVKDCFFFKWSLILKINRKSKELYDVKTGIDLFKFGNECDNKMQKDIKEVIHQFETK